MSSAFLASSCCWRFASCSCCSVRLTSMPGSLLMFSRAVCSLRRRSLIFAVTSPESFSTLQHEMNDGNEFGNWLLFDNCNWKIQVAYICIMKTCVWQNVLMSDQMGFACYSSPDSRLLYARFHVRTTYETMSEPLFTGIIAHDYWHACFSVNTIYFIVVFVPQEKLFLLQCVTFELGYLPLYNIVYNRQKLKIDFCHFGSTSSFTTSLFQESLLFSPQARLFSRLLLAGSITQFILYTPLPRPHYTQRGS